MKSPKWSHFVWLREPHVDCKPTAGSNPNFLPISSKLLKCLKGRCRWPEIWTHWPCDWRNLESRKKKWFNRYRCEGFDSYKVPNISTWRQHACLTKRSKIWT